ncbi:MAG: class IV adenylate cyclase [bacterium]|nr:class IV adenylate cyclase [bacterium]
MPKSIEIEIQVNIENKEPLLAFLEKNADFKFETRQIDEYFTPAHRDFTVVRPVAEWLRLRDSSGHYSFTYKNWHYQGEKSFYCDEYETEVKDLDQLKKAFAALNFKSLITVDKTRKVWLYRDFEVAVDSVKNLGDFVEIEYKGEDEKADPEKTTERMIQFLKDVGCGKIMINYMGYPYLLLFPKEAKYKEV